MEHQQPSITVHFLFKQEIFGALKVCHIVHWCSQEVEVQRKSPPLPSKWLKQSMDLCKLRLVGSGGEAPAVIDFGACFVKRSKLLVQLKFACNV